MSSPLHAIEYLDNPQAYAPGPICALFGDEPFLKRQVLLGLRQVVLGGGDADFSLTTLEGPAVALRDVLDELSTIAMFGGGKRLVVIDDADDFVTRFRAELEDYLAKPRSTGVLVLDVTTWPANTRLAKGVAASGLAVQCKAPPDAQLARWLTSWAQRAHNAQLSSEAAEMLLEMVGPEVGLLDQELAKLTLSTREGAEITPKLVRQMVGSWRAKTAWDMLDATLDGNARNALVELDRLLRAGEHPVAILAQVSASLRRLAAATRLILAAEAAGRRLALRDALQQAGVKPFVLEKSARQLRRLGRHRGEQLFRWLLDADLHLKGSSELPPRLILERLLVRLAASSS